MKDIKSFYTERLSKMGVVTIDKVKNFDQTSTKMTEYYQTLTFGITAKLMGNPGKSVLDIGCGAGEFLPFLRAIGWEGRYVGVDIVPGFISGCEALYAEDQNARFYCGDYTDRYFNSEIGNFDTVVSLSIFGLVERPSIIREIVEAGYEHANIQYLFTCNSTEGYGKKVNKDAQLYRPADIQTMVLGHTQRFAMTHYVAPEGGSSVMGWRLDK